MEAVRGWFSMFTSIKQKPVPALLASAVALAVLSGCCGPKADSNVPACSGSGTYTGGTLAIEHSDDHTCFQGKDCLSGPNVGMQSGGAVKLTVTSILLGSQFTVQVQFLCGGQLVSGCTVTANAPPCVSGKGVLVAGAFACAFKVVKPPAVAERKAGTGFTYSCIDPPVLEAGAAVNQGSPDLPAIRLADDGLGLPLVVASEKVPLGTSSPPLPNAPLDQRLLGVVKAPGLTAVSYLPSEDSAPAIGPIANLTSASLLPWIDLTVAENAFPQEEPGPPTDFSVEDSDRTMQAIENGTLQTQPPRP